MLGMLGNFFLQVNGDSSESGKEQVPRFAFEKHPNFDYAGARAEGYSNAEIINYLESQTNISTEKGTEYEPFMWVFSGLIMAGVIIYVARLWWRSRMSAVNQSVKTWLLKITAIAVISTDIAIVFESVDAVGSYDAINRAVAMGHPLSYSLTLKSEEVFLIVFSFIVAVMILFRLRSKGPSVGGSE